MVTYKELSKAHTKNFGMVSTWKTKKWKTSKFVDEGMRQKGINNLQLVDRERWRRKIKLKLYTQKDVKHQESIPYINNYLKSLISEIHKIQSWLSAYHSYDEVTASNGATRASVRLSKWMAVMCVIKVFMQGSWRRSSKIMLGSNLSQTHDFLMAPCRAVFVIELTVQRLQLSNYGALDLPAQFCKLDSKWQ